MTNETIAPKTIASTAVSTKKTVKPVKKATKKAVKKAVKTATPRAGHVFTLTPKATNEDFGSGQRFEIAKRLKKGSTRTQLIAALPDIPAANISWHLSMFVKAGLAKKTAAK